MFYINALEESLRTSRSRGYAMARLVRMWRPQVQGTSAVALREQGVCGLTAKSSTASGRPWLQSLGADIDAIAKAFTKAPVLSSAEAGADIDLRSDSCSHTELALWQRWAIA